MPRSILRINHSRSMNFVPRTALVQERFQELRIRSFCFEVLAGTQTRVDVHDEAKLAATRHDVAKQEVLELPVIRLTRVTAMDVSLVNSRCGLARDRLEIKERMYPISDLIAIGAVLFCCS